MEKITIYDMYLMHRHFAEKKKLTKRERAAMEKLNERFMELVEGMRFWNSVPAE